MNKYLAGFDVGGTDVKFGIIEPDGKLIYQSSFKTPYGRSDQLIDAMCRQIEENCIEYPVSAIGIGCAGYANPRTGIVTDADNLGMTEIRFREKLEEKLYLPVRVDNDVQVALIAEHLAGSGRGVRNIVYVSLGTGVGGAYLLDGKYYRGQDNGGAEIGHMIIHSGGRKCCCGMYGCFEQYASITALVRDMKEEYARIGLETADRNTDGKIIFSALRKNEPLAWKVYDSFLENLCVGLISLMNLFAPELIIIGGALSNEGAYFAGHIQTKLRDYETYTKYLTGVKVIPASFGNRAGLIGAALLNR